MLTNAILFSTMTSASRVGNRLDFLSNPFYPYSPPGHYPGEETPYPDYPEEYPYPDPSDYPEESPYPDYPEESPYPDYPEEYPGFGFPLGRRLDGDLDTADKLPEPEQRRRQWWKKGFGERCSRGECGSGLECQGTCKKSAGQSCWGGSHTARDAQCASDYCRNNVCTPMGSTAKNPGAGGFGRRRAEDLDVEGEDLQMDLAEDEQDRRRFTTCQNDKDCRTGWGERQCSLQAGICVAGTGVGTSGDPCMFNDHCNTRSGFTCNSRNGRVGTCVQSLAGHNQRCSWDYDCQSRACENGFCVQKRW